MRVWEVVWGRYECVCVGGLSTCAWGRWESLCAWGQCVLGECVIPSVSLLGRTNGLQTLRT